MSRDIIEIDGSYLEGGGQILRMSLALSAIQGKPIKVINIRAGRTKSGLMPQHLTGLLLSRDICGGRLEGGVQGSTEITLIPGKLTGGEHHVDTKTAGSVMLLVQAVYLCTLYGNESSHIVMRGGTDVDFAPPVDYTIEVFRKISSKFGANFNVLLNRRGFYPKGNGEVIFKANPIKTKLNAVEMVNVGDVNSIRGKAYVAGKLQIHVAQKMVDEAKRILMERFGDVDFDIKSVKEDQHTAFGNGSGIVLWAETSTGCILGGSSMGRANKDARMNGKEAAEFIIKDFNTGACLDQDAQNEVVILMALAEGTFSNSIIVMSLTHAFDELVRSMEVLNDPAENKFLEFVESVDVWRSIAMNLQLEVKRLQGVQMQSQKEIHTLDMKLRNARHLIDVEKSKRHVIEKEKEDLAQQIITVMELLGTGRVNETKERLRELHSLSSGMSNTDIRFSYPGDAGLSTIREGCDNSAASILSVSDIDLTDDGLEQDDSRLRSGRSFRKRKSEEGILNTSNSKPCKTEYKGDTSKDNLLTVEMADLNQNYSANKSLTATHEATDPPWNYPLSPNKRKLNTNPSVTSVIEDIWLSQHKSVHTGNNGETDFIVKEKGSMYPLTPVAPVVDYSPRQTIYSPKTHMNMYTPGQAAFKTPPIHHRQSTTKLNTRQHAFYVKTVYKSETCQPCGKRVKFGKSALKCRDCRATCHQECKDSVPRPCVPTATTPNRRGQLGVIADFTTQVAPMVPAIIVHITNEVEKRGLSEMGIYRIPGSEKEVKALKDQFLRGKGMPNISQTEVHTLCGTLKDFLRSLKESLVTHLHWNDFARAVEDPEDSQSALYQVITELPQPNRDTLAWIITHLQRVADCPDCKMPASNLAKVFGPTLVGYSVAEPEAAVMFAETRLQQMVMEGLLNISSDFWSRFINIQDENLYPGTKPTPEMALSTSRKSSVNGGRRRSILMRTPLPVRDTPGSKYSRK